MEFSYLIVTELDFVLRNKCFEPESEGGLEGKRVLPRIDTTPDERRNFTRRSSQGHTFSRN
jgi:hypothetical protein